MLDVQDGMPLSASLGHLTNPRAGSLRYGSSGRSVVFGAPSSILALALRMYAWLSLHLCWQPALTHGLYGYKAAEATMIVVSFSFGLAMELQLASSWSEAA